MTEPSAPTAAGASAAHSANPAAAGPGTLAYRILHLSDVHFGASFDDSLWEYVTELIRRERPDLLACTGDIVDHGGLFMLALARRQFDELPVRTGVPLNLRTVPGNHDLGPWGNLRFRPFSSNFLAVFGPDAMALPRWVPSWQSYRSLPWAARVLVRPALTVALYAQKWFVALQALLRRRPALNHLPVTRDDDPPEVTLVYLDSNHALRLATGNVDVRELSRLKAVVLNLRDQGLEPPTTTQQTAAQRVFAPRIALMHHHPLPLPNAVITEGLTSFEPFLVLRNAGFVLKELNRCDVDLILHGHKHYASFSRLGYSLEHSVEGEIAVLSAGSAGVTHGEAGRNSVNFVDVYPNGRLTYTAIHFGGGAGEPVTELFRNTRYVHGMEMHKRRVHRRGIERHGQWSQSIEHSVQVDARGVALVSHLVQGLKFERDLRSQRLPVYIRVSMGRVPPSTLRLAERSRRNGHIWLDKPRVPLNQIACAVDLGQPLSPASPPVDFGYEYLSFNTYAVTEWETERAYERDVRAGRSVGRVPGLEFTGVVCRAPARELVLRLTLPADLQDPDPRARVMRWHQYPNMPLDDARQFRDAEHSQSADGQAAWEHDTDLTEHEGGRLLRVAENRWELRVQFPLVGHRYDITWRVRGPHQERQGTRGEIQRQGVAESFRRVLLGQDAMSSHQQVAKDWVQSFHKVMSSEFCSAVLGRPDVEVAVFAYDAQVLGLRMVLSWPPQPAELTIPLGEGVVGAAMKRRAVVAYVDPRLSGNRHDAAYLYDQADEANWSEPSWSYVVALPLFGLSDPRSVFAVGSLTDGWLPSAAVGVLTLSSKSADSGLVRLTHPVDGAGAASQPEDPRSVSPDGAGAAPSEPAAVTLGTELTYTRVWALAHLLLLQLSDVSASSSRPPPGVEEADA